MRIGFGYDVHAFIENRPLILGGVHVPHSHGLLGHSDADVLLHAICDALLGAAALGDIGRHFPDSDPAYAGISSLLLLGEVSFIPEMIRNVSQILAVPPDAINIKATTTEKLGFTGRAEGIAAYAVATLEE
jgi:2-C-methyl-D-erythritol 2,4-cyclodiphosphate synthase